jgi:hypothetical protein
LAKSTIYVALNRAATLEKHRLAPIWSWSMAFPKCHRDGRPEWKSGGKRHCQNKAAGRKVTAF